MFPVVAHKDLTDFIDLCKTCGTERLYVSINHDLRRQQMPDRIAVTKWLSLYLSAFFIDPTTKSPFVSRFWTVECVDSDGAKDVIARPEEDIRKFYLLYIKIAEEQIGCPSLRGYATWLGDPALVPGTPGMLPKEWVDAANASLVEDGVFTPPESVPEAEGGPDVPEEPENGADGQDTAPEGGSEPVGEVPDAEYEAAKEKAAESADAPELEVTTGDPANPTKLEVGDDYEETDAPSIDLKTKAEKDAEG